MLETNLISLMFIVVKPRELKLESLFLVTIIHKFYFTEILVIGDYCSNNRGNNIIKQFNILV